MRPFLTFYTPTYGRPKALVRCLASVAAQTAVADIEHIVVPDHVGVGVVEALFGRLPQYMDTFHGEYVHLLADDDVLPNPGAVAELKQFARAHDDPPVIVVTARKGPMVLPSAPLDPPHLGAVDCSCFVQRTDIFRQFVGAYVANQRYEGDFDHAYALWQAGIPFARLGLLFVEGGQGRGRPEVAA